MEREEEVFWFRHLGISFLFKKTSYQLPEGSELPGLLET